MTGTAVEQVSLQAGQSRNHGRQQVDRMPRVKKSAATVHGTHLSPCRFTTALLPGLTTHSQQGTTQAAIGQHWPSAPVALQVDPTLRS